MNLIPAIFRKPAQPLRHVIATRAESRAVSRKRIETQLQLAVYVATVPLDQRKAETDEAISRARQIAGRMRRGGKL